VSTLLCLFPTFFMVAKKFIRFYGCRQSIVIEGRPKTDSLVKDIQICGLPEDGSTHGGVFKALEKLNAEVPGIMHQTENAERIKTESRPN
jgi:hypothetical protein